MLNEEQVTKLYQVYNQWDEEEVELNGLQDMYRDELFLLKNILEIDTDLEEFYNG